MDLDRSNHDNGSLKRKRLEKHESVLRSAQQAYEPSNSSRPVTDDSPTVPSPSYTSLSPRNGHVQISYLARQYDEDIPLISSGDTLPSILSILNNYSAVIDRGESMAGNMGARPLGPILMTRLERIFDGPPKVLSSSNRQSEITWLDVIAFAKKAPDHFNLIQLDNGSRVCQIYTKQCRVQISEEDFFLINSGIPQKLIPPQPIAEDEEKELGTLDIVEKNVYQITQLADQVAVRARQLNHRLKCRKHAIAERRAANTALNVVTAIRPSSPSNVALINGLSASDPPTTNVIAADSRQNPEIPSADAPAVSQATYNELMKSFFTLSQKRSSTQPTTNSSEGCLPRTSPQEIDGFRTSHYGMNSLDMGRSMQSYPNTTSRSLAKYDGGPFKAEMVAHLETLAKGDRIEPPCDRCRRLHMDCLKNLTACMGCTKKHAKCCWKDVRDEQLRLEDRGVARFAPDQQYTPVTGHYSQENQSPYPDDGPEDHIAHQRATHLLAITAMDRSLGQDDEHVRDRPRYID